MDLDSTKQEMTLTLCMQQNERTLSDASGVEYATRGRRLVKCENEALSRYRVDYGTRAIGEAAFEDCNQLQELVIPDTVKHIGDWAFNRCGALQSLVVPPSVTTIGNRAFSNCKSLKEIVLAGKVKDIGDYAFLSCDALETIAIPKGTRIDYLGVLPPACWPKLKEIIMS